MRILNILTIIILIVLLVSTVFFITLHSLAALIGIATGIAFVYYLLFFIILKVISAKKLHHKNVQIILWIFFLAPVIWALIHPEGLFEVLMFDIKLDMK